MIEKDYSVLLGEGNRCILCKNARCKEMCPINTPIPQVIDLFKKGQLYEAGEMLFKNNPLSVICSVVCPHEDYCQNRCIKGIKDEPIRFNQIEHFISKRYIENTMFEQEVKLDDKIAIIGSGPAGVTVAFILAQKGYQVTIFEKNDKLGGVLRYGIPEFRLSNSILDVIEEKLYQLNVKIKYNCLIGPVVTLDKILYDGYKAAFIGTGVWNPKTLDIKGETLGHVNYAIDYLKSPNSFRLGRKVVVIGAGNVAMDAARVAKRRGSDVYVMYRKGFEQMSATQEEIKGAKRDEVEFMLFKSPVEIVDEGIKVVSTEMVESDGKVSFRTIDGTEDIIECDSVIIAVSQAPQSNIVSKSRDVETTRHGLLVTDEKGHTTKERVFACGDVVTGAKTVAEAVADAKVVANTIDEFCGKDRS